MEGDGDFTNPTYPYLPTPQSGILFRFRLGFPTVDGRNPAPPGIYK